jgi:hypothetical protein
LGTSGPEVPLSKLPTTTADAAATTNHESKPYRKEGYSKPKRIPTTSAQEGKGQVGSLRSKFKPKDPTKAAPAKKAPAAASAAATTASVKVPAASKSEVLAKAKSDALKALLMKKVTALKGKPTKTDEDAPVPAPAPTATATATPSASAAGTDGAEKNGKPEVAPKPKVASKPKVAPKPKPVDKKPEVDVALEIKMRRSLVPSNVLRRKPATPSPAK